MITKLLRRRRGGEMSCREVARVMQEYLDGELHDPRHEGVAAHREKCRRCGLEAEVYRAIKRSLGRGNEPLPTEAVHRLRGFADRLVAGDEA